MAKLNTMNTMSNTTTTGKTMKEDGFINLPVTRTTRAGLHLLKDAMGVRGQAEVVEKLVAMGVAIHKATR